jgi:NAD(P)-dependent dehydrogenase (short-subunit alcohol dehydrogenase family)
MNVTDKTVLITGANRGIGHALLEEALDAARKKCTQEHAVHGNTPTSA